MNHYEELGVNPRATQEEIHQAYRNAVKLMHPDRQTDPAIREIAERQMLRLNSIAQVLLDPEQRLEYDHALFRTKFVPRNPRDKSKFGFWRIGIPVTILVCLVGWLSFVDLGRNRIHVRANQAAPVLSQPIPSAAPLVLTPLPDLPDDSAVAYKKHLQQMTDNALRLAQPAPATANQVISRALKRPVLVLSLPARPSPSPPHVPPPPVTPASAAPDASPVIQLASPALSNPAPRMPQVTTPVLVEETTPVYPAIAKQARVQGLVVCRVTVALNGQVSDVTVLSGPSLLASAAKDAILKWHYKPATRDGTPIEATVKVPLEFRLY